MAMPEMCFFCVQDRGLYCQEPSVSEIEGTWIVSTNGQEPELNRGKKILNCSIKKTKEEELTELRKSGIIPGWARIEVQSRFFLKQGGVKSL